MAKRYFQDEPLKRYFLKSFAKGYNSFTGSKTQIDDEEFPTGINVYLDDNGSVTKRAGSSRYGGIISTGNPQTGFGTLKTTTLNKLIVASSTQWFDHSPSSTSALTGTAFTANQDTDFAQAIDRLYGANGVDPLAYTTNGTTITSVTVNGNVGRHPVYYNNRLYMTNTTFRDRIYYSNPINIDYSASPPTLSSADFGTFDTNLSSTPKKNAGYIILIPGGGVEIMRLYKDVNQGTESLYAYTKSHGVWQVTFSSLDSSGAVVHSIRQIVTNFGTPGGLSVVKVMNDQWFYGGDNYYSLGEVAQFANLRITTKSARVKRNLNAISGSSKSGVAAEFFKEKLFVSYQSGSYNDTVLVYDARLNAWSAPFSGINARRFIVFTDDNGNSRMLAASSNSADPYLYELETGVNDNTQAVQAFFETKSTDCGLPGIIKRFAFIDVFYTTLFGVLNYEVFIDETTSITGVLQVGTSASAPSGFGSLAMGTFAMGFEGSSSAATIKTNDKFRIPCLFSPGQRVSVRFTNTRTNEQFKINSVAIYYQPGNEFELPS
jgi:hypothetical protein